VVKIAKVADFGLNSRKSLRKAKSLLRYFKAFRLQSGIADIGAIFVPFSPQIVAYAIENYQMHDDNDNYHYKDLQFMTPLLKRCFCTIGNMTILVPLSKVILRIIASSYK
jgi:hypothetical protein